MAIGPADWCSIFIGLVIRFFGQNAGLGVAQRQYAQNGRLNAKDLPGIMLQALIGLWSGAAVGPEGPLVFLTGGVGSAIADRLRIRKDDVQVLVYSSIAGAFGGFFGSPIIGAVGAFEYMYIKELDFLSPPDPRTCCRCCWLWGVFRDIADLLFRNLQFPRLCFSSSR